MVAYKTLSDLALLDCVLRRQERAWAELMRRYRGLIYRCITKVTSRYDSVLSSEVSNEIFADVCVNLLRDDMRKLRAYDADRGSKLGSWLGLIAIHSAYDYLRSTARQPIVDRLDGTRDRESGEPSPEERVLLGERRGHLMRMLADFTERHRTFVEVYVARGLAPEAVARAMNISVKTVYSKKNKIRTKLEQLARRVPSLAPDITHRPPRAPLAFPPAGRERPLPIAA